MQNENIRFKETILEQIKDYLDCNITKEKYYELSEEFYSTYAKTYQNPLFHDCFLHTVADACLFYIDEPGLSPEMRESLFHQALSEAYLLLQKI